MNKIEGAIEKLKGVKFEKRAGRRAKKEIAAVALSFDIETTSLEIGGKNLGFMYEWTFAVEDVAFYGRTWAEFGAAMEQIRECLGLSEKRTALIFVHNLAFEFSFLSHFFPVREVFALDERKPVKAIFGGSLEFFEFRCSYQESGKSLKELAKELPSGIEKLMGDLDYTKVRTSATPLSVKELKYCENDVLIVTEYIRQKAKERGGFGRILLTKTSYVREQARDQTICSKDKKEAQKYRKTMRELTIEPDEYIELKKTFQGGFTHANVFNVGRVFENVGSFDFTSSYPAVMVSELYPMGKGQRKEFPGSVIFREWLKAYCMMFRATFYDISPKIDGDNPISASKCVRLEGARENNGRVSSADCLALYCTEVDFSTYCDFYEFTKVEIDEIVRYRRGYLPKPFVNFVLDCYADKTTLKGVAGQEDEYRRKKETVNSLYGMIVTDIVKDDHIFEGEEWKTNQADTVGAVEKYNKSASRFLFYPWGVWVTAYARRNLFDGLAAMGGDYLYSDTDSLKILEPDRHLSYFEGYNNRLAKKYEAIASVRGLDINKIHPKDIKGKAHPLGAWDYENEGHNWRRFRTLGAKRYLVQEDDGSYHLTVAGLSKQDGVRYMIEQAANAAQVVQKGAAAANAPGDPFEFFDDGMLIPEGRTGKNTHTYFDGELIADVVDYLGNSTRVEIRGGCNIRPAAYDLSIAGKYKAFIERVQAGARDVIL